MFHVTIPHPLEEKHLSRQNTDPLPSVSSASFTFSSRQQQQRQHQKKSRGGMLVLRWLQFLGPIVGILLYVASSSSEHWVVTESLYRWGLFSECKPDTGYSNGSVMCVYMTVGDSPAYFQAVQGLAGGAMLLYAILQFQFVYIRLAVCRHQLSAAISLLLTVVIAVLLLVLGVSYRDDARWRTLEPSLGWSYWAGVAVAACSLVTSATLIYRGYEEHKKSDTDQRSNQVYPSKRSRADDSSRSSTGDGVPGENKGTQSSIPQISTTSEAGDIPGRRWRRRLSPIFEKSPLPTVAEGDEGGECLQNSSADAAVPAPE